METSNAGRWFNPQHTAIFGRKRYTPYMQGGGWILSRGLASLVVLEADLRLNITSLQSRQAHKVRPLNVSLLPSVEDALVGELLCSSPAGPCSPRGAEYHNLIRHMSTSSPAVVNTTKDGAISFQKGLVDSRLCEVCSFLGMLLVHPLKLSAAQQECFRCSSLKMHSRCYRFPWPDKHKFRAVATKLRDHELCCAKRKVKSDSITQTAHAIDTV